MATYPFTEPLHVYSLSPALLDGLYPRAAPVSPQMPMPASETTRLADLDAQSADAVGTSSTGCTLCLGAAFKDVSEQRAHFRSDWHRYSVKLRLRDAKSQPVSEASFAALMDGMLCETIAKLLIHPYLWLSGLEDSLSGSASSSSNNDSDSDAVSTLLSKTRLKAKSRSPSPSANPQALPKSPIIWMSNTNIPDTQFGIYSTLFPTSIAFEQYVDELKEMQARTEHGRQWAVFMTAGGHFAGAIVRVSQPLEDEEDTGRKKKAKHATRKLELEVVHHKTFHRYTSRRTA